MDDPPKLNTFGMTMSGNASSGAAWSDQLLVLVLVYWCWSGNVFFVEGAKECDSWLKVHSRSMLKMDILDFIWLLLEVWTIGCLCWFVLCWGLLATVAWKCVEMSSGRLLCMFNVLLWNGRRKESIFSFLHPTHWEAFYLTFTHGSRAENRPSNIQKQEFLIHMMLWNIMIHWY